MEIIKIEIPIHNRTQTIPGSPVTEAILAASEWRCEPTSGALMKKSVFKSASAFNMHCTARNARAKLTHRSEAYLASATSPAVNTAPEKTVKIIPPKLNSAAKRFQIGAKKPKR